MCGVPLALAIEGKTGFVHFTDRLWEVIQVGICEIVGFNLSAYGQVMFASVHTELELAQCGEIWPPHFCWCLNSQVHAPPSLAALLMALESPFALLAGVVFLGEVWLIKSRIRYGLLCSDPTKDLSLRAGMGCCLMGAAILLASYLHSDFIILSLSFLLLLVCVGECGGGVEISNSLGLPRWK